MALPYRYAGRQTGTTIAARKTTIDTPFDPALTPETPSPAPDSPPPVGASGWARYTPPDDTRSISVGGVIGEAWRTYRRAFGPLLLIGLVVALLLILLSLPGDVYTLRMLDSMLRLLFTTDFNDTGIYDPILLRSQLDAIVTMPTSTVITFAVAGGASVAISILGGCVLTAGAMTARAGRTVSPTRALAAVLSHGSALVLPAILIALGSIAITIPLTLNAQNIQQAELAASAGGSTSSQNWLTFASIVVAIAIFYLSVRWSVAIPAILAEDIGLRAGLGRSSQLTRGFRLRLAGAFLVVSFLQVVTVVLPSVVIGLVVGFTAGSAWAGVVVFAVAAVIGSALFAPIGAAIAAVAYGQLTERATAAAPPT
jgi:hypothetical protein